VSVPPDLVASVWGCAYPS